jgi:hypothetical protein
MLGSFCTWPGPSLLCHVVTQSRGSCQDAGTMLSDGLLSHQNCDQTTHLLIYLHSGFPCIAQAGLKLLGSSDPSTSGS